MAEAKLKIIRKKWLPIKASAFFDSEQLGECYVTDAEKLLGRTITANLANLTGDIRQQSVTLRFVVNALDGQEGVADAMGYDMAPSAVRRIVRRGSDRIDESFPCETIDARKILIKPMLITKTITNGAVHGSLRKMLISSVIKQVKKHTFESLINEIITSKLQMAVKTELKKVYPLRSVEIKTLRMLKAAEPQAEQAAPDASQETVKAAESSQ